MPGIVSDEPERYRKELKVHAFLSRVMASMLFGVEIPPAGGRTGFLNMYQALETLPLELQERLKSLTIKNDATYNSAGQIRRGMSPVTDVTKSPGVTHPAVRTNPETGFDALYLGRRPHAYVNGLTVEESEGLLDQWWAHATSLPAWYHEWRVGDVVVWDNRCVMHRREPFDPSTRRFLHRAQTRGLRPERLDTASRLPHPRSRFFAS
jgi:taurine dioxygenase